MARRRFSQKTNEQIWFFFFAFLLFTAKKPHKFVRSFFGRIYGAPICFWFYLTFRCVIWFHVQLKQKNLELTLALVLNEVLGYMLMMFNAPSTNEIQSQFLVWPLCSPVAFIFSWCIRLALMLLVFYVVHCKHSKCTRNRGMYLFWYSLWDTPIWILRLYTPSTLKTIRCV